jgi:AAA15 family ATPase/GTPase
MKNNHLTYFKIENFKKFDSLEVKDIGQFNLIVGDNNVGKTCLLEALLFDEDGQQLLNNFYIGLTKRGLEFQIEEITRKSNNLFTTETISPKSNYFKENIIRKSKNENDLTITYFNNKGEKFININASIDNELLDHIIDIKNIVHSYKYKDKNDFEKHFIYIRKSHYTEAEIEHYWIYDYDTTILNFPLISFNDTPLEEETRGVYENLKSKREKQILIEALKIVNPKILDIELRENFGDLKSVFLISFDDLDEFVPLNNLGDGFKRIFYIVLKAISLRGQRIMIDEVEIGIHYSKMKEFWVNIIKVCKELEVQLFATTHSSGCVSDFVKALEIVKCEEEARMIQLKADSEDATKIYSSTYLYENIVAGLDSNLKLLGDD